MIKVDSLDFRRQGSDPKMYVTLNSIKSAAAGDGLMSNLIGRVKGAVANIIIPPVPIRMDGNEAMLGFAQAIVDGKRSFTFPLAQGTLGGGDVGLTGGLFAGCIGMTSVAASETALMTRLE